MAESLKSKSENFLEEREVKMVVFFGCVIIGCVLGYILACKWGKNIADVDKAWIIVVGGVLGVVLGVIASFWAGSYFVKKEIIAKQYVISPMIFDGKIIAGLFENRPSYTLQIKEGDKTRLIKHCLYEKNIFFTDDSGERYLEVKRRKTCRRRMWVWFFCGETGIIESKAVLKKGDEFLMLPRYYSL